MSASKKHRIFFYRNIVLALFLCAFAVTLSPTKVYAALPVYQCVGIGVAANSPGCTKEQTRDGTVALVVLRSVLKNFDEAKAAGNEKEQAAQTIKIAGQLTILEYPIGADPVVAARQLLNQEVPKREAAAEKPLICDGFLKNTFNPICWARTIAAVVGSLLMTVAAWALAIAGVLFNWSVINAVILFKDVIFEPIKDGINIGWTAFRDISNIVIIGMFAFIAISIILGNKEFGQKKLVARVLIIAVLINFSLLFTKMIIDASNFTAGQFYAATQGGGKSLSQIIDAAKQPGGGGAATSQVANPNTGVNLFSGYAQEGIAGQFVRFLGVIDVADTYSALKNVGDTNNNGWIIIVHALFAFVLLLGAAIVLFYGSFLLISRAIILIFLLLTSAIAFASHLIPKMSDGQFGWSAWWKSLLGSAVLAPLLMIFLYITLQIASNLQAKSGTLGNLISGDAKGGDVNALFAYLLVLGLLFGSFKLASSFSAKIGGFNFAAMATALPLTLGSRAAALGLRMGIGAPAYFAGKRLTKEARADRDMAATAEQAAKRHEAFGNMGLADQARTEAKRLKDSAARKMKSAGFMGKLADSRFNVMDTSLAKMTAKAVGITGFATGESSKAWAEKSVADRVKIRAEAAEKMAAKIAPSTEQNDEARREARRVVRDQRQMALQQLEATRDAQKASADAMKTVEDLPRRLAEAQQNALTEKTGAETNMTRSAQKLRAGTISQTQHMAEMTVEKQRIERANAAVQGVQQRINIIDSPVRDVENAIRKYERKTHELAEAAGRERVGAMQESAVDVAEKIGEKQGDVLTRALGSLTAENKAVADETKDLYKRRLRTARFRDAIKLTQEENGGGAAPTTAPAAPHP